MKTISFLAAASVITFVHAQQTLPPNRLIDYAGFMEDAAAVQKLRDQHRVTEDQFLQMAGEPGTIILDARTNDKFDMLHIAGARHLALTDVTTSELAKVIPSKDTRILIYCNNNFLEEPEAFTSKVARASLNIYTFNTLYSYGYKNVYELGPLTDIRRSRLPFVGTRAALLKQPEAWVRMDFPNAIAERTIAPGLDYSSSSSLAPFLYTRPRNFPSMNASRSPSITP